MEECVYGLSVCISLEGVLCGALPQCMLGYHPTSAQAQVQLRAATDDQSVHSETIDCSNEVIINIVVDSLLQL